MNECGCSETVVVEWVEYEMSKRGFYSQSNTWNHYTISDLVIVCYDNVIHKYRKTLVTNIDKEGPGERG